MSLEGCEISQGGVRNLAGGGAKFRRGGVRNLAPRTVIEPSLNPQRTEDARTPEKKILTPGDRTPQRLWGQVVTALAQNTTPAQRAAWIAPARIAGYGWDEDGTLCVELATVGHAQADMIDRRYSYLISDALARVYQIPASRVALEICVPQHVMEVTP